MPVCVPNIAYQNKWLGQASAISSTNIFTTSAAGIYRITLAGAVKFTDGSGSAELGITGTPLTLSQELSGSVGILTPFTMSGTCYLGSSAAVDLFFNSITFLDHADIYVSIEQLQ